jgi:hypothetical protein
MKQIADQDIEKILDDLGDLDDAAIERLFQDMDRENPAIIDYLHEVEGDAFKDAERNLLVDTAIIGWHIIKETVGARKVKEGELDERLEKNTDLFDVGDDDADESEEELKAMFSDCNNQPALMLFLVSLVVDQPEERKGIRDDLLITIIVHLKTVVDCLVRMG